MAELEKLFSPRIVAIIGASSDTTKVGGRIFKNALFSRNTQAFPINPKHKQILGQTCYASIVDFRGEIDVAVIAVRAEIVPVVLKEIIIKKVPYAIIISSGFKEAGAGGEALEKECAELAQKNNLRLLGPNCLGILSPNLNLTFAGNIAKNGPIAVISQSGAIGSSLVDWINKEQVGIHSFISLGNKADLSENDFLEYYAKEKKVSAVFLYLESFKNGREFFQFVSSLTRKKPIVVLKPGATKNAVRAMTSHTGALVTDAVAYQTAFSQANVINAQTLEDFFNLMKFFSIFNVEIPHETPPSIITNAGGVGVLLADLLPNALPLDLGGAAKTLDYENALKRLPKNLNLLFCIITPQEMTELEKTASYIVKWQRKVKYPIFTIIPGGGKVTPAIEILRQGNCMVFDFPEEAVRIYQKINNFSINQIRNSKFKVQNHSSKLKFKKRRSSGTRKQLEIIDVQKLAKEYKLPLNEEYPVETFTQCFQAAKKIGFPVVLKAHGEKIFHKTEFNAVRLNIATEKKLHDEYQDLSSLTGTITVSRQFPSSFEAIIGVKRDVDFGHLLMFGMGGIYTEIMKDLSYGLLPLSRPQIVSMIKKTRSFQVINGARGLPSLDMNGIVSTIQKLNKLILENPWIIELDINPLLVGKDWVKIVDLKIKG